MNVLSLFDGMSCAQLALQRLGKKVDKYLASEVDVHAINATKHWFPNTIHIGDVQKVNAIELPRIDLLCGGSPCQGFSLAGKGLNFEDPRSKLFFEFVRLWREIKKINPEVKFFLENVRMLDAHEKVISKLLGVNPILINSALVSAQNRERLYWTDIGLGPSGLFGDLTSIIQQPKDKGIVLRDILEEQVDEKYYLSDKALARIERKDSFKAQINPAKTGTLNTKNNSGQLSVDNGTTLIKSREERNLKNLKDKANTLLSTSHKGNQANGMTLIQVGVLNDHGTLRESNEKSNAIDANFYKGMYNHAQRTMIIQRGRGYNKGGEHEDKARLFTSNRYEQNHAVQTIDRVRRLTPVECCRLQTVPDDYFKNSGISETQQYKMLGNGWTIDVITHILSHMK